MQSFAEPVVLRDGTTATAVAVVAPDREWAEQIEFMLRHKGDPWNWQIASLLRQDLGVGARFFILHRDGTPFAQILVVETAGTGIVGHVWTDAPWRGKGASAALMDVALNDFWQRGGRALFLSTAFDGPPWHYYRRRGFAPLEAKSGQMSLYRESEKDFDADWFGAKAAEIETLQWTHWPASAPLFMGAFPGGVRLSAGGLIGRRSPETPLLTLLREEARRRAAGSSPCAQVLRAGGAHAILGLASAIVAPAWPDSRLVDLYCHPDWWHRAGELLALLPDERPHSLAYADADHRDKRLALERAGFKAASTLPHWVATDAAKTRWADVVVYIK